jgi:hypothetical protein
MEEVRGRDEAQEHVERLGGKSETFRTSGGRAAQLETPAPSGKAFTRAYGDSTQSCISTFIHRRLA